MSEGVRSARDVICHTNSKRSERDAECSPGWGTDIPENTDTGWSLQCMCDGSTHFLASTNSVNVTSGDWTKLKGVWYLLPTYAFDTFQDCTIVILK